MNENKETVIVDIIENFANLPKSDSVSINVQACGHEWKVRIYPRAGTSRHDDGRHVFILSSCYGERTEDPLITNAFSK